MSAFVKLEFSVDGSDFESAGRASEKVKLRLKQMGFEPAFVRRVAVCMYEGEINMVIHAHGGTASVEIYTDRVQIELADRGPGIPDIAKAMQEGFSTAPDDVRSLGFGAGMGLPNMKRYSDDLAIESTVGVGTTVRMRVDIPEK